METYTVVPDSELAQSLGLNKDFSFNRKVVRATIDVPHAGNCDCYVVHFKSKRTMIELDPHKEYSPEKTILQSLKAQVAGRWGSTVQRGSEATLLMMKMLERRETTAFPMILMGDFNNNLTDGVLSHILTNDLRFVSAIDCDAYLEKYCLNDAWELFQTAENNEARQKSDEDNEKEDIDEHSIPQGSLNKARTPTHYFGAESSVLDYVLLSCEFDAGYHDSLYQVTAYDTYDRHLINPIFDRDGESTDHGIVMITLSLRT